MRLLILAFLLSSSVGARAQPIELACWWEQHSSSETSDDTGQFFENSQNALKLSIDIESNRVDLPDRTDAIILPNASLIVLPDRVEVSFVQPNMRAIKGQPSLLKVSISRYSLESWITLSLPTGPSNQMQSRWMRRGQCSQKKF